MIFKIQKMYLEIYTFEKLFFHNLIIILIIINIDLFFKNTFFEFLMTANPGEYKVSPVTQNE